jgi:hypothetical protein
MGISLSDKDLALWQELCSTYYTDRVLITRQKVRQEAENLVDMFRYALLERENTLPMLNLAVMLTQDEIKIVFQAVLFRTTLQTIGRCSLSDNTSNDRSTRFSEPR